MKDAKTLKLAYRPVTAEALKKYMRLVKLELDGMPSARALQEVGISGDDVTRIAAAVGLYCRPRLLKKRLACAAPGKPERQKKQREELAAPIDDRDFVELYGKDSWELLQTQEDALIALREKSAGAVDFPRAKA